MTIDPAARVVFVCEQPAQAQQVHKGWKSLYPDAGFTSVITTAGRPGGFAPRLPRALPIRDTPTIREPEWNTDCFMNVLVEGPRYSPSELPILRGDGRLDAFTVLREADVIVCATDADGRGAFGFRNLIRHCFDDFGDALHFPRLHMLWGDTERIARDILAGNTTRDEWFARAVARMDAKRFFESNWANNALPLLGRALGDAGASGANRFISKYALQFLYWLREHNSDVSEHGAIRAMRDWTGTGKYKREGAFQYTQLGSASSFADVIEQMADKGLVLRVQKQDGDRACTMLELSQTGHDFLDLLHPGCRDADLPFRLQLWGDSWPESRPSVERYIRTIFGRQKKFSGKAT